MKSFLGKFLLSFLLVLMIPAIAILLLYGTAENLLRQEIVSAGESNLIQFFTGLDLHLAEMIEVCVRTYLGAPVRNIVYSEKYEGRPGTWQLYEAQQFLKLIPNSKYYDLFVYYIAYDRMVSSRYGCLDRETYYQAYYKELIGAEEFDSILEPEGGYKPVLFAFPEEAGGMLGVAWRTNVDAVQSSQPQITIVAILRESAMNDILEGVSYGQNGEILIFDREKNLLISTAGDRGDNFVLNHDVEDGRMYRDIFAGESYMMLVRHSQVLDCYYAYAIPERVFWEKSNLLRLIGLIGLILCMSISALVAVVFAKKLYNPITMVLHKVKRDTDKVYDRKASSEMEFISSVLEDSFRKNRELYKKIHRRASTEREEFLMQCLNGTLKMDGSGEDVFAEHGLKLKSDCFSAVLIRFESADAEVLRDISQQKEWQLLTTILQNVYMELCERQGWLGYLVSLEEALFCLVINYDCSDREAAVNEGAEICGAGKQFLEEKLGIVCTVASGNVGSGLEGIRDSYREALCAMQYRFVYGGGSIVLYRDIQNRKFCYRPIMEPQVFWQILHDTAAKDGGEEKIRDLTARVFGDRQLEKESLETLEYLRVDVTNVMNRIYLEAEVDEEITERQMAELLRADTFADFREKFADSIRELWKYKESRKQESDICVRVKHYVGEHYRNPDLNVNALGEALGLSPSYVSRLFREESGTGVLDYLNRMRIERARELLKESEKSVEEIALEIGFINGRALIKVFKRYEGITPGAYRGLVRKQ